MAGKKSVAMPSSKVKVSVVKVLLEEGFNQLVFEALNEGSSAPNTAQVDVYDDMGQLIYSNKWLLSAGAKASLVITKE